MGIFWSMHGFEQAQAATVSKRRTNLFPIAAMRPLVPDFVRAAWACRAVYRFTVLGFW